MYANICIYIYVYMYVCTGSCALSLALPIMMTTETANLLVAMVGATRTPKLMIPGRSNKNPKAHDPWKKLPAFI